MAPTSCVIYPDKICFICVKNTFKSQQSDISDFVKKVYFDYFELKPEEKDKPWPPHKVFRRCEENLRFGLRLRTPHFAEAFL